MLLFLVRRGSLNIVLLITLLIIYLLRIYVLVSMKYGLYLGLVLVMFCSLSSLSLYSILVALVHNSQISASLVDIHFI